MSKENRSSRDKQKGYQADSREGDSVGEDSLNLNGDSGPALRAPAHLDGGINGQTSNGLAHSNGLSHAAVSPLAPETVYVTRARQPQAAQEDGDPILSALMQAAWQRKWTIMVCVVAGLVAGLVYLSRAENEYRSTATIYMDQAQPKLLGDSYGTLASEQSMATQVQLLTSTSMLRRALDIPTMSQADLVMAQDNPAAYLRSRLKIDIAGDAEDILYVSMQSASAQDNAIAVNALVQAFAEYHNERRRSTAAEVLKVLRNESNRLNNELDELEGERLAFQQENASSVIRTSDGNTVNSGKLRRLSETLTEAELRHLNARLAYLTAVEIGEDHQRLRVVAASDPVFAGIDFEQLINDTEEFVDPNEVALATLTVQRIALMEAKGVGIQHPTIIQLDQDIAMLKEQIRMTGGPAQEAQPSQRPQSFPEVYREMLRQRLTSAAAAEQEYRELYEAERKEAVALNSVYAQFENIERQVQRASRQLEIIDERMRELNLNDDYDVIDVTVLEPAVAGFLPVSPNRSKTMGMALVMSLMLGCGLAYLQEMMDDRLRSGEEISTLLKQPILGAVPSMEETALSEAGQTVDLKPQSIVAEAFRTIRTAIHFNPTGMRAQVLMITSPSPGDGKSTIASNLAIAFASSGKRTLLIDADCRKPRQHRIFELEPERGLSSLLTESPQNGKPLDSPLVETSIKNLHLMPCGPIPDSPAEILNRRRFAKVIDKLREHYDHIIIDTPPTIPVSDSRIIACQADGYVLVLRAGRSGRKLAKHASDLLGSVGARPMGLVINGVTGAWGSYSYYSRYGYHQYGYGEYREEQPRKPKKLGRGQKPVAEDLKVEELV
ncbi:MAG: polysaccharide biosynthesis tyrosine autokinase [Planctomycetota bacterium]